MTSLIELGTQAVQGWFHSLATNGARPQPTLVAAAPDLLAQGLAASQNLWLKTVKATLLPFNQAVRGAMHNPWFSAGQSYWQQTYEATLGTLARIPLLGQGREVSQKIFQTMDALARLYPASLAYQGVLIEIQQRSLEAFLDELIALTAAGTPLTDGGQLQPIWSRVADQVFAQTLCAQSSLRARGQFLNALNHYRICQQDLLEIYLTLLNLPTRREVDDIHQSLYALRKEVKHLKKTLPREAT